MDEKKERIAIFLDWHNLEGAFRGLGGLPDVLVLRDYLVAGRHLVEAIVYAGVHPDRFEEHSRFHSFLRENGFLVGTKLGKLTDNGKISCNLDVEMAVGTLDFAREARPDTIVLGTGDGDFVAVAKKLRSMGIRVEIASTRSTISQDLLEMANGFIDLEEAVKESSEAENEEEGGI